MRYIVWFIIIIIIDIFRVAYNSENYCKDHWLFRLSEHGRLAWWLGSCDGVLSGKRPGENFSVYLVCQNIINQL